MESKESFSRRAVKTLGSQLKVAALVGVTQQAVCLWIKSNRIPAEHILKLEEALMAMGSSIDRHDLRPDVYGPRSESTQSA
jgi:DNA-binding transcriptional regulator YdaS (Cro superfamily)